MRRALCLALFIIAISYLLGGKQVLAQLVYQNFEPPAADVKPREYLPTEYGWGFNGAQLAVAKSPLPVHGGTQAWQVQVPPNQTLSAGVGIASRTQRFNFNFQPQTHDRLTFWLWPEPSYDAAHNVMVKFFDQGKYKVNGFAVWTQDAAAPRQWTKLTVLFAALPEDFDWQHVDKLEFFHYWDGIYYYDDIEAASGRQQPIRQAMEDLLRTNGGAVSQRPESGEERRHDE